MAYIATVQAKDSPTPKKARIDAASKDAAIAMLERQGYKVISIALEQLGGFQSHEMPEIDGEEEDAKRRLAELQKEAEYQKSSKTRDDRKGDVELAKWNYSTDGQVSGVITHDKVKLLIQEGKITWQTYMWNPKLPDWVPITQTDFRAFLVDGNRPPPLTGNAVNSGAIWFLAFSPFIAMVVENYWLAKSYGGEQVLDSTKHWLAVGLVILMNSIICAWDAMRLKAAGHSKTGMWAAFFVPAYLFRRSKMLNHNLAYFIVWWCAFILQLLVHPAIRYS